MDRIDKNAQGDNMAEAVDTFKTSEYPGLWELVEAVRKGEEKTFPEIGSKYDGIGILRCGQTIDKGYYLMVLQEGHMFYIQKDDN